MHVSSCICMHERICYTVACRPPPQDDCAACLAVVTGTAVDCSAHVPMAMQQGLADLDIPIQVLHPGDSELHLCLVVGKCVFW